MVRAQYHFRPSDRGLLAWDVRRLIERSRGLPVFSLRLTAIAEIDENHWFGYAGQSPTCRALLEHMRLIDQADLRFPIILSASGRVMDGMHRVCKAVRQGHGYVPAVQFITDPDPDFVGVRPADLPYDD